MAVKGIDVSVYQGNIDWAKVKASGIGFAILRVGYGRCDDQKDKMFEQNYKNAKAIGMPIGIYHYSYAKTADNARQEAKTCLKWIKGKKFEYPVAFDIEDKSQTNLGKATLTAIAKAFCEEIEKAGYYPCIYASKSWLDNKLDMSALKYDVWVAQWTNTCTYKGAYGIWQNSDNGSINGISGRVDTDISYKDYPTIMKTTGKNGYDKPIAKITVTYQTHDDVKNKWLPYVEGDFDYAGNFGNAIDAVRAKLSSGNIYYKVHTKSAFLRKGKWLPEVKNFTDYAGNYNQPIDAVAFRTDTGRTIKYRVHEKATNRWLDPVTGYNINDAQNGYAGNIGKEIDAIKIWLE